MEKKDINYYSNDFIMSLYEEYKDKWSYEEFCSMMPFAYADEGVIESFQYYFNFMLEGE